MAFPISLFKKNSEKPLLSVSVNGRQLCAMTRSMIPYEEKPSVQISGDAVLEFADCDGAVHKHDLVNFPGWYHFSIRVQANLACQSDCVISEGKDYDPHLFSTGKSPGIRFQPFFLSEAKVSNAKLYGKGLFARGLHFNGTVTRGNVILSCECDACHRSFSIHSYHAGFSNSGYFYSASGRFTITVSDVVPGCPIPLSQPDSVQLRRLESALPSAPDGTRYAYLNPFRCPHCSKPYIDFERFPEMRPGEYYGNYFVGSELLRYEPVVG